MGKRRHYILGVHVTDRAHNAAEVQKVFTENGCYIRTRLGLHEVQGEFCAPNGLILLEMVCDDPACEAMTSKLAAIPGVEVQQMVFEHT